MRSLLIPAILAVIFPAAVNAQAAGPITVPGTNYTVTITEEAARKMCVATDQRSGQMVVVNTGMSSCINGSWYYCEAPVWRDSSNRSSCEPGRR